MAAVNSYILLDQFKHWIETPGQELQDATVDDSVIILLLESVSRFIDRKTGRHFYPVVETRSFDVPENTLDDRVLWLDDDLLAVTTVTNGDATTLASTEYNLYPANYYPKYAIRILQSSDYYWERDSNDNREQVIDILGYWGYHSDYGREAWITGSTLNEGGALTAADLTWTVTSAVYFKVGQIVRLENELCIVNSTSPTSITVRKRGDNGSTAAIHADGSTVYIWNPEPEIAQATAEIAVAAYHRRWGVNVSGVATITGAGVVITPQDVPSTAREIVRSYEKVVP